MARSAFTRNQSNPFDLPSSIKGRNLFEDVIPIVGKLEDMLMSLKEAEGNFTYLDLGEKRSYAAYCIGNIEKKIMRTKEDKWFELMKEHILKTDPFDLGANALAIYLVAYVSENYGQGQERFNEYIIEHKISSNIDDAQAIWEVGTSDGVYLKVLKEDGTVDDWNFFKKWVE